MKQVFFNLNEDFESIIHKSMPNCKIYNAKLIPTGWTNIVYEVETDKGNYFFRFPRDEFWSRTIVKDCEFSKYINKKTDYKTVELKLLYDNGRPFSMHKKIEGIPLAEKMNNLSNKEIEGISKDIAKFMYQLHNIKDEKNNIFTVTNIGTNLTDFLDELLNKHIDETGRKFWNKKNINNKEKCLVHGDLNSSNILLDKNNNVTAIIDFGFAGFGNKYNDIGRIIGRCPENFKSNIIEKYEECSKEKLDNNFLEENIETWNKIDNSYIDYMTNIGIYKK